MSDPVVDHLMRVQADQAPAKLRAEVQDALAITPSDQLTRWLALGGVVGPVLFVVAFIAGGVIRPGYSPIHQAASDLGVGSNPWLLNVPLVLLGVLLAAFATSFFRGLRPALSRTWRWICAVLLACTGLGFADAGIFTEAPATVALHWMVGMSLLVLGSVVGFLVTGLALRRDTQWRTWSTYSLVTSLVTLVLIAVLFWVWTPGTPLAPLNLGGLMERVLFIEILAWYVAFGWRLFRGASSTAKE
ncbi:MAG TPA: DUF998 domain-containing protein [Ktedonobacterales bacterium]|nr:DUF998 domain-containing protein [Ktedonobacterales bacterium]